MNPYNNFNNVTRKSNQRQKLINKSTCIQQFNSMFDNNFNDDYNLLEGIMDDQNKDNKQNKNKNIIYQMNQSQIFLYNPNQSNYNDYRSINSNNKLKIQQKQNINQTLKRFNEEFQKLIKMENRIQIAKSNHKKQYKMSINQNKTINNQPRLSQNFLQQNKKNKLSRLSQRVSMGKLNQSNKKNNRKTISNFQNYKRLSSNFNIDLNKRKSLLFQSSKIAQNNKMQIQPNVQNQQINQKSTKNQNQNSSFQKNFVLAQQRKTRNTMSMNQLMNLLGPAQNQRIQQKIQQKPKQKIAQNNNNRFTLKIQDLTSFLQQQNKQIKNITINSNRINQSHSNDKLNNKKNQQNIIYEDQKQDEFTPYKKSQKKQKQQEQNQILSKDKNQQQKQKYNDFLKQYYEQIQQRINQQVKFGQQIDQQNQNFKKQNQEFKKIIIQQNQNIRILKEEKNKHLNKIKQLTQTLNFKKHEHYLKTIALFQSKLNVKFHYFKFTDEQNYAKGLLKSQAFYAEFTFKNMLLRIKRQQVQEFCRAKIILSPFSQKLTQMYNFIFDITTRIQLYNKFFATKISQKYTFFQMLIHLNNFERALYQLERTIQYFTLLLNLTDLQMDANDRIMFKYTISQNHFSFQIAIDLLNILDNNGGISVYFLQQKMNLNISEQIINSSKSNDKNQGSINGEINKLYNCIEYIVTEVFQGLQRKLLTKS